MYCPVIYFAKELISIPSISPIDNGCQKIIAKRLFAIGFTILYFQHGETSNLLAYKGKGIILSFAGHTDVVPPGSIEKWSSPPFIPKIIKGYLFGRGSSDMKGSLAAMVIAAERFFLSCNKYIGKVLFLITSDEESCAEHGTKSIVKYLQYQNCKIQYCIIGEPTSKRILGDIVKIGRRGSLHANLLILGKQGHIAYPMFAKNPIHLVIPFLNSLINTSWSDGNKYFQKTSMQIYNIVSSINSENVIPGNLYIKFNFRFGTDTSVNLLKKKVYYLLKLHNLSYSIKWKLSGEPFLNLKNNLVYFIKKSIKKYCNIDPNLSTDGGTSDGRFLKDIAMELLEIGSKNDTIHQIDERVLVSDLQNLSLIYQDVMENVFLKYQNIK
ncbi:succinyl-diaminopimelate desuccinylase [Buchnera aphidicola]|uniref:succinyl-diaminopimelate desuccinylase n=1 Tax=Buchnera aphidicola TaxID=9 RepID=UPI0031B810E6